MKQSLFAISLLVLSSLVLALGFTPIKARAEKNQANHTEPAAQFVPGRLLVKFRDDIMPAHARNVIAALGARDASEIPNIGVHILDLPYQASEQAFVNAFKARAEVEFAELDSIVAPAEVVPNDPWYANTEWHLRKISAPSAWDITTGSSSVVIAILDTGVNSSHEDLSGNMVPGWNVYANNSDSSDITGHGTLVAGTAAALSNNGIGVTSVAWHSRLMPVRVTDGNGMATYSNMAAGLTWAADHGARVANLSFNNVDGATVTSAAKYFQQKGGVVVTSAGNDGISSSAANNSSLINVSATDPNDALYSWSNRGSNIDLAAPGYVYTTSRAGGYTNAAGTSVAAPIVSGVAALVLSLNPALTPAQLLDILTQSADDLGSTGWDSNYGYGRVNARRAVELAGGSQPGDTTSPVVQFVAPSSGATLSGTTNIQISATDNVGVTSISASIDGVPQSSGTGGTYSLSWDTTKAANGAHTIVATALDAAGNAATTSVSVVLSNVAPVAPTVAITAPTNNSTVSGNVSVYVRVTGSGIMRVELYVDGKLQNTSTASPYTTKWNARREANGPHVLQCVVYDTFGNIVSSAPVTVLK